LGLYAAEGDRQVRESVTEDGIAKPPPPPKSLLSDISEDDLPPPP
jgi:hypothetical protein